MARREEQQSTAEKAAAQDPSQQMGMKSTITHLQSKATSNTVRPQSAGVPLEIKLALNTSAPTLPVRDTKKVVRFGATEILEYIPEQEEESEYEYVEVSESESEYEYEEVSEELLPVEASKTRNFRNTNGTKVTPTWAVEDARNKQQCQEYLPKKFQGQCSRNTPKASSGLDVAGLKMDHRNSYLPPSISGASAKASAPTGPAATTGKRAATQTPFNRHAVVASEWSSATQVTAALTTASPIIGPSVKPASPSDTSSTGNPTTDAVPSISDKRKSKVATKKRKSSKKSKGLDLSCPIMTMNKPGNEKLWTHEPNADDEEDNITTATTTITPRKQPRSQSPKRSPRFPSNNPRSRGVCAR